MKILGTSSGGNPIVELEEADRMAVLEIGAKLRQADEFLSKLPVMTLQQADNLKRDVAAPPLRTSCLREKRSSPPSTAPRAAAGAEKTNCAHGGPAKSPVRDLVLDILNGAKEPMTPKQLAAAVEMRGYKFTGSSAPQACVSSMLRFNSKLFRCVGKLKEHGTPGLYISIAKPPAPVVIPGAADKRLSATDRTLLAASPRELTPDAKARRLELLRERDRALAETQEEED
jgi:hypothetical protein